MRRAYLDHNAASPPPVEVIRAMESWLAEGGGNPSSIHWHGRRARAALEEARQSVAELIAAEPEDVIFTSGATEANNLAVLGVMGAASRRHMLLTAVEHESVAEPARRLVERGMPVTVVPVDRRGRVDPDRIGDACRPDTALAAVMMANHETGVLQPVREIAVRLRRAGVPLHVDAAQAVSRLPVDVEEIGADLLSLSGPKMGGPPGVGALWVRRGTGLAPLHHGGGQQGGRRAGTEPVLGAVGLGAAARLAARRLRREPEDGGLRDSLEAGLLQAWPGAVVHGDGAPRLPNTTCIGFPGLDGEAAVIRLDLEGVSASRGSACSSGTMRVSPVLLAMGVDPALAGGSLRFSLGPQTGREEVVEALAVFRAALAGERTTAAVREGAP